MATTSSADDLNGRSFSVARKGYNRDEVDSFRRDAIAAIRSVERDAGSLRQSLQQLGIEEGELLRVELDKIGQDVAKILQDARAAAENMRTRAVEDSARWRNEADDEARVRRADATKASEALRAAAWESSHEMIGAAKEQTETLLTTAQEDAFFMRAEAERESVRLTGNARQDADALVRESQSDADELLTSARRESEGLLFEAQRAADSAQQRARALEERRVELMAELETARQSISQISAAAHLADSEPESLQKFIPRPESQGWTDAEGTVRVVLPAKVSEIPDVAVDALAMADEVAELHKTHQSGEVFDAGESVAEIDEPIRDVDSEAAAPPDTDPESAPGGQHDELDEMVTLSESASSDSEPASAETEAPVDAPVADPPVTPSAVPVPSDVRQSSSDSQPDLSHADDQKTDTGEIDALFAALRDSAETTVSTPVATGEDFAGAPVETAAATKRKSTTKPTPRRKTAVVREAAISEVTDQSRDDQRVKLTLPLENRTLRLVKKHIVAIQNHALEELRTSDQQWRPSVTEVDGSLVSDIDQLVREAHIAGYSAEAERQGVAASQPGDPANGTAGKVFLEDLLDAVNAAIERAVSSGAGGRQVASAASKVFRAWRSDEAERRLRSAARAAYEAGSDELGPDGLVSE